MRIKRLAITYRGLRGLLTINTKRDGDHVWSDLPDDIEVVGVVVSAEFPGSYIYVTHPSFPEILEGEKVETIRATDLPATVHVERICCHATSE